MLCVRAYNDWMIDDWCATDPARLIPLTVIPCWDPHAAAAEVRRCAAKGARAITFSEQPELLGLPTIWDPNRYWDPLWDACQETQTVVCTHIGSGSNFLRISSQTPFPLSMAWGMGARCASTLIDWLFAPVFRSFPGIKIALSEGGIGWIPYFIERAGQVASTQRALIERGEDLADYTKGVWGNVDAHKRVDFEGFDIWQVFRDHVYGGFIDDQFGVMNLETIGVENVLLESDYPHSDSTWPDSVAHLKRQLALNLRLTEDDRYLLMRGHAERLFRVQPPSEEEMNTRVAKAHGSGA